MIIGTGIAESVYRLVTGWTANGLEFEPDMGKICLYHVVQIGSGANPASYKMAIGNSFPEIKRPGSEAQHSPPPSADAKNT
jgi:hypothetical protein